MDYLPGGTYNIWGQYGGDSTNGLSTSAPIQVTVIPEASTNRFSIIDGGTLLTATPPAPPSTNIPYGTQLVLDSQPLPTVYYVQCVINVLPPTSCLTSSWTFPTGTVTFADGATTISSAQLNAFADAEYSGVFGVGARSVTSNYLGDNSYTTSTGSAIAFSVVKDVPILSTASSSTVGGSNFQGGQATVFQILVSNTANLSNINTYGSYFVSPAAAPTGTITVTGLPPGVPTTAILSSEVNPGYRIPEGVASLTLPAITAPGTYVLTATYPGDANYAAASVTSTINLLPAHGLTSTTTANLTGSISPASSGAIVSGTVTGQAGNPAPTGGVLFVSNGYTLGEVPITPGPGDNSTYTVAINNQGAFQGTNLITVQYTGDTVYNESAATVSVLNPLSDFSLQSEASTLSITAGNSGTTTIDLTSVNSFAGNVSLTCTPVPGVTCSIAPSSALTAGGTAAATLTVSVPADSANLSYNVTIIGTDSTGAYVHTLGVVAQVSGSPAGSEGFALTNTTPTMNLAAGVAAGNTSTVTVLSLGGYSGSVTLSCSVASVFGGSITPFCSLSSTTATVSGTTSQTSTLIVNTASGAKAQNGARSLFWPSTGGVALALGLFFGIPKRRWNWIAMLGLLVLFTTLAGLGCGGPYIPSGGTPALGTSAGTYTVTVTGTSGSLTQTTTVNLTVTN